jgi:hypothetical protein
MNFISALLIFIRMYLDGFFFSASVHRDPNGTTWGFWRFNNKVKRALFDVDFSFKKDQSGFAYIHGDDYRLEFGEEGKISNIIERKTFIVSQEYFKSLVDKESKDI